MAKMNPIVKTETVNVAIWVAIAILPVQAVFLLLKWWTLPVLLGSLLLHGIPKVHRDTFHASLGAGRYLLALCWFATLTGRDITANSFTDFDKPVTADEREIVISAVNEVVKNA